MSGRDDEELEAIKHRKMVELQKSITSNAAMYNIREPINLTDSNFKKEISKYPLLLIDFWAPWCGPCRMMSPLIDQIGKEYMGKSVVGKVNVDENPTISRQFGISSIPTLILFKKGQAVNKIIGSVSKNKIDEMVRMHLE